MRPNATRQTRLAAGAERTLAAVACTRLFGAGYPIVSPGIRQTRFQALVHSCLTACPACRGSLG
jgi:hypothetical protein